MSHITPDVRKEFPTVSFADISKIVGKRWATLSSDDKKPFEAQAAEDYVRWEKETKNFVKK